MKALEAVVKTVELEIARLRADGKLSERADTELKAATLQAIDLQRTLDTARGWEIASKR